MRYFVRNDVCQLLPRKFKVAFTADDHDRAITLHPRPRLRAARSARSTARPCKGFEIRTGGGTSIMPRVGGTFWEFASIEDGEYLKVSEAVLRIFDRQEDLRANRARARIKFLIDRVGIEEFQRMVDEELKGDWVARARLRPRAAAVRRRRGGQRARRARSSYGQPERRRQRLRRAGSRPTCSRSARRASPRPR